MEKVKAYYYAVRRKLQENKFRINSLDQDGNFALMFHDIVDGPTVTRQFCSNEKEFFDFIRYIDTKYGIKTISDHLEKKGVVITFDDGFSSVYDKVLPYFREKKIPFTVFITTDFVDRQGYLSRTQLLELAECELCTIGAHTMTHPRLRECAQSKDEIELSGKILCEWLGCEIPYFAYPFGSLETCSAKNRREAKEAGYKLAFSTIQGSLKSVTRRDYYFLPRVNGDPLVAAYSKKVVERLDIDCTNLCSGMLGVE